MRGSAKEISSPMRTTRVSTPWRQQKQTRASIPKTPATEDPRYRGDDSILSPPVLVREDLCHNGKAWERIYTDGGVKAPANAAMRGEIEQRLAAKMCRYVNDMECCTRVMETIL
jgi:hypothetical protein